ncbi:glutamate synthase subunit beta [Helicobacter sp. MIT 01-3238]|uniref:glutamate synthase subunit beta n=1 Tax=Helicobacter sp. MIT 01-3238 TaxID=398627 RepID=UPI000E1EB9BF|nr:glutamate synthase [Helicobacter sp. MIT 01-3238]
MGNPRGFIEFSKQKPQAQSPKERIKHYREFYTPLPIEEQQRQAGRCMDCGVAFCHTGINAPAQKPYSEVARQNLPTCTSQSWRVSGGEIGCPLHNLIPEWNDLVYRSHWEQAYHRLSLTNPFPEFTGRVCPAPCEDSCVCAINGESVAIKNTELNIIENAFENGLVKPFSPKVKSGKKVAIIGSGPAGLACANSLNELGHSVVVYERSDKIGGLLMYGIPDMKLDKSIVQRRVEIMQKSGIEFRVNEDINTKSKADKILAQYDAVVLATGASKPIDLQIEGRDSKGVMFAMDFLRDNTKKLLQSATSAKKECAKKGGDIAKDKRVLIIGSGDTSVDCVAVALRQGASSITRFERSPKREQNRAKSNPWPLKKQTFYTDYGLEEAIEHFGKDVREYQKLTKKFIAKNGQVSGVVAVDLEWKQEGEKRVRSEVSGSEKEYKADLVLLAMGFSGSEEVLKSAFGVEFDSNGNVATKCGNSAGFSSPSKSLATSLEKETTDFSTSDFTSGIAKSSANLFRTSRDKVYACGDSRIGQSLVVWAIADGICCAKAVHSALNK